MQYPQLFQTVVRVLQRKPPVQRRHCFMRVVHIMPLTISTKFSYKGHPPPGRLFVWVDSGCGTVLPPHQYSPQPQLPQTPQQLFRNLPCPATLSQLLYILLLSFPSFFTIAKITKHHCYCLAFASFSTFFCPDYKTETFH